MAKIPEDLSDPVSLRLPVSVLADLEKIALASERTRSWIMVRALRQFIAAEGRDILAAAEGMAQIDRGEFADMDDVIAELEEADRNHRAA